MRKKFTFFSVLFLTLASNLTFLNFLAFSQGQPQNPEAITITTYYPAPFGVYEQLRLFPIAAPPAADCNLNSEGTMYFDNGSHQLKVCRQNAAGQFVWQSAGLWTLNGDNLYPDDTNWNIGIGTTSPQAKLDINGQVKIRGGSPAQGRVLTSDNSGLATWEVNTGVPLTGWVNVWRPALAGWSTSSTVVRHTPFTPRVAICAPNWEGYTNSWLSCRCNYFINPAGRYVVFTASISGGTHLHPTGCNFQYLIFGN
jgi:hypothetical protein